MPLPDAHTPSDPPTGGPPSYDEEKQGYVGISAGVLGSVADLESARAFAEMIVDTVREGLLILDLDFRVVAANESFYHTFGVAPEDTIGQFVYDLGNGQWDLPELRELLEGILPEAATFDGYEVDHEFEGVGRRVMVLNARRLDDHQLVLLAIEDATERRTSEDEVRRSRDQLEGEVAERTAQVRELARALSVAEQAERRRVAHLLHDDLQQYLHGLTYTLELLRRACPGTEAAALHDRAEQTVAEAARLTRSLSHDLAPPLLEGDDLADLLGWLARRKRDRYGLEVEVDVAAAIPVPDEAIRVLLYQLLKEVLFNVAKHAGTKRARLVAERVDDGGPERVRVVVEDEGDGFDPAAAERGGGFGLPSVAERVGLVGGHLDVASAPGRGTRVSIEVPTHPP